ncbi:hypothetical protein CVT25_002583, partial [Psilocybe cyanescens]
DADLQHARQRHRPHASIRIVNGAPYHAEDSALLLYALASHHGIASRDHRILVPPSARSDDASARFTALKDIRLRAPVPHPETKDCSFVDQKQVIRAWALASAYLVRDAQPGLVDISMHTSSKSLHPLLEYLTCKTCKKILQDKIKDDMVLRATVKVLQT